MKIATAARVANVAVTLFEEHVMLLHTMNDLLTCSRERTRNGMCKSIAYSVF